MHLLNCTEDVRGSPDYWWLVAMIPLVQKECLVGTWASDFGLQRRKRQVTDASFCALFSEILRVRRQGGELVTCADGITRRIMPVLVHLNMDRLDHERTLWMQQHLCPLCKTPKNVWGRLLLKGTSWRQITCLNRNCRNTRTSAKWLCNCGKPWYLCNIHAPLGHLSGTAPRSNPEQVTKESRKRGLINTNHGPLPDELLRKRRHAEGHEDNHMRDRKRKTSLPARKRKILLPISAQNNKIRKIGDHDDAIATITRLRASRTQAASSGEGLN